MWKSSSIRTGVLVTFFSLALTSCDQTDPVDESPPPPTPLELQVPDRFPEFELPADNPLTVQGVELGRMLFYDPILSRDSTRSCASCHQITFSFSDPDKFSEGVGGVRGRRQAMPVMNMVWVSDFFWDGRAESLEDQALQPVQNDLELNEDWSWVVEKLIRHKTYPDAFEAAFETRDISPDLVVKALAQFERTIISGNSKFDRVNRGEAEFTELEQMGFDLFFTEKGDCFHCHGTILFTDNRFHNNGLDTIPADSGLAAVTKRVFDIGKFRSPTLRNIEYTAPYMHDGRFQTLEEVLEHYNFGRKVSPTLDPLMRNGTPLFLTDEDIEALLAFLKTLSDPEFLQNPKFKNPFE